nr:glycosyltransferase 25 family member [Parasteatoda tepidariorum]
MLRLLIFITISLSYIIFGHAGIQNDTLLPTVLITVLIRNKAHTLPYFFAYLEQLDYPRDRISLWIRSDHNVDDSVNIIKTWLDKYESSYHSVDSILDDSPETFPDGSGVFEWSPLHFDHIISLKESALKAARKLWADYIFFLDADVFLVNNATLKLLIEEEKTVIAPVLETLGAYSNYWCGMTEQLICFRIRSDHNVDDSVNIIKTWLDKHESSYHSVDSILDDSPETFPDGSGVFEWSPLHFDHIISLKESALKAARKLWADYIFFIDADVFLVNNATLKLLIEEEKTVIAPVLETLGAYSNYWCGMTEQFIFLFYYCLLYYIVGVKMFVTNKEPFGYMMTPLEKENTLQDDREQLLNLKIEMLVELSKVAVSKNLEHFVRKEEWSNLGFDQIYLINLERRPLRKQRMLNSLTEMGIQANLFKAVDGKALNDTFIQKMGIKMLPEYADPYHKRPLTRGEIGCFLSHYYLWKDMIEKQHRTALVLEDDLRFEPYFRKKVQGLLKEAQKIGLLWDLIYLGRKRLSEDGEPYVQGTSNLVHVDYSYWTLCYLITLEGAKKLIAANPLPKLVPVDEFLPIMFDRHPEESWKGYYPKRNLRAFSAHPLLVYPTHYTGDIDYISDTEDSDIAVSSVIVKDEL